MVNLLLASLLLAFAPAHTAGSNPRLRGVVDATVSDGESGRKKKDRTTGGGFHEGCLSGRFSYFNTAADAASLTVGVFDGSGNIVEMDDTLINHSDGEGGRAQTAIAFNSGTYEVRSNGRGTMYVSLGEEGGPYYDPPAEVEFVVTSTSDGCEITSMDSFVSTHVGVSSQLVAPHWSKIADN